MSFFRMRQLGVDVGAEGLLESVDAGVACLWVAVVSSVDEDVGGIVGVVGVADGMSELSSAGRWSDASLELSLVSK